MNYDGYWFNFIAMMWQNFFSINYNDCYSNSIPFYMNPARIIMSSNAPDSRSCGRRKDLAWKYHTLINPKDINSFECNFCGKRTKGGVFRAK